MFSLALSSRQHFAFCLYLYLFCCYCCCYVMLCFVVSVARFGSVLLMFLCLSEFFFVAVFLLLFVRFVECISLQRELRTVCSVFVVRFAYFRGAPVKYAIRTTHNKKTPFVCVCLCGSELIFYSSYHQTSDMTLCRTRRGHIVRLSLPLPLLIDLSTC